MYDVFLFHASHTISSRLTGRSSIGGERKGYHAVCTVNHCFVQILDISGFAPGYVPTFQNPYTLMTIAAVSMPKHVLHAQSSVLLREGSTALNHNAPRCPRSRPSDPTSRRAPDQEVRTLGFFFAVRFIAWRTSHSAPFIRVTVAA